MNERTYFVLGNRPYTVIKWLVQIFLPAFSGAYFALGRLWGWENVDLIVGTMAIITTFLGAVLGISSSQYNKMLNGKVVGEILVPMNDFDRVRMSLDLSPEELKNRNRVVFNIKQLPDE
jgi:hypothetical protein